MEQIRRVKLSKRIILFALFFCMCALWTDISSASDITINPEYGTIVDSWKPTVDEAPHVWIIEDAHCNFSAQKNISNILKQFLKHKTPLVVCIEGAYRGIINTDIMRVYDDDEKNHALFDTMLEDGSLSAAEYVHLMYGGFVLRGLEDELLYKENVKEYQSLSSVREQQEEDFAQIGQQMTVIQSLVCSPALTTFLDKTAMVSDTLFYTQKQDDITHCVQYLIQMTLMYDVDLKKYPSIWMYDELSRAFSEINYQELVQMIKSIRAQEQTKISLESDSRLFSEADKEAVRQYPALERYFSLREKMNGICFHDMIDELRKLKENIAPLIAVDDDEKKFLINNERYSFLYTFLFLTLRGDQFAEDRMNPEKIDVELKKLIEYIQSFFPDFTLHNTYEKVIPVRCDFYKTAIARENYMTQALYEIMQEKEYQEKPDVVALIGGFHSPGMRHLLQSYGIAYTVIRPVVQEVTIDDKVKYFRSIDKITFE